MILAFDTYYFDNKAKTVCLAFDNWATTDSYEIYSEIIETNEDYISGEFYKRELPCIMSLYKKINLDNIEAIIIDGFVFLDDGKKMGLGGYLYQTLASKIPIIGVAKTNYFTIEKDKRAIYRGISINPIYITAIGIDLDMASELIQNMSGEYRIPTILKKLDTLTKVRDVG